MTGTEKPKPLGREEQAKLEIGVTQITRAQQWVLAVSFLALIFGVPVIQQIHELGLGQKTHWARFWELPANAAKVMRVGGEAQASERPRPAGAPAAAPASAAEPGSFSRRFFRANSVLLRDIHQFEDDLADDSLLTRNLVPPVQRVLTGALGAGNEKAYVGRERWLFYRPDVDYLTGAGFLEAKRLVARAQSGSEWRAAPQPDPLIAVFQFRKQLAERGIQLVIVPTPAKPVVHPEMFSARYRGRRGPVQNASLDQFRRELADPAEFFARYQTLLAPYAQVPAEKASRSWHWQFREALQELAAAKDTIMANPVLVFDPAPALVEEKLRSGQPQYLETDTHWRPEAVALVARRLNEFIGQNVTLPTRPPAGYQRQPLKVSNLGDIAVMMKLPAGQTLYPPQAVTVQQVTRGVAQWRPDPGADVLLLGDSFTNVFSAKDMGWGEAGGLAEQLSFEMQRPLDLIVRNDAGASATREMLSQELARGSDRLAGKRLVIWQFAVRELAAGDWRVRSTPMRLGQARESSFLQVPAGQKRLVSGTVRQAASAPRPGTVTYPDHVVYVHLTDLESADGQPLSANEALVTIYSMRNQVWTNAARYRPGQQVRLELRNYDEADRQLKISRVKSSLLANKLAEEEIPCWAEEPAAQASAGDKPSGAGGEEPFGGFGWAELAGFLGVLILVIAVLRFSEFRERRHAPKGETR
jgi:alginate O-acetyltransferase complex protein AlgJ